MLTKLINFIFKRTIKGNINTNGDKIFYEPGHRLYDYVDAEKWFKTKEEAMIAGFRKPMK